MSTSSEKVAATSVILRVLGSNIRSQQLLRSLCLVGHYFHAEFSPFLYHHMVVRNAYAALGAVAESSWLSCARHITISNDSAAWDHAEGFIRKMLPNMPNLESFTWRTCLTQAIIDDLRRYCPRLKAVHVVYPENIEEYVLGISGERSADLTPGNDFYGPERAAFLLQDISSFTGLKELVLKGLYNDLAHWRSKIPHVLLASPGLEKLGLSVSGEAIARCQEYQQYFGFQFFDAICNDYSDLGGSPLKLRSLHCGTSFTPSSRESLDKLVDLTHLEHIYVENSTLYGYKLLINLYLQTNGAGRSGIPFDDFLSRCPRLRSFSAGRIRTDILEALSSDSAASVIPGLALTFREPDNAVLIRSWPNHPRLPLYLRMIDYEDSQYEAGFRDSLTKAAAEGSKNLEGMILRLTPERGPGGSQLVPTGRLEALYECLPMFKALRQLSVTTKGSTLTGFWESAEANRTTSTEDPRFSIAEKLAGSAPILTYVGVDGAYWKIWRGRLPGESQFDEPTDPVVRLETLKEEREVLDVELFRLGIFDPNSAPG